MARPLDLVLDSGEVVQGYVKFEPKGKAPGSPMIQTQVWIARGMPPESSPFAEGAQYAVVQSSPKASAKTVLLRIERKERPFKVVDREGRPSRSARPQKKGFYVEPSDENEEV